jgi:arylamine N-acetyltransferase
MAIVVKLDGVPYLVDVGYGESLLRRPLPILNRANQRVLGTTIRLQLVDGRWVLQQGKQTVYRFNLHPRLFQEFEPTYRYQLESERNFCKHIFFSRANENGFVRLVDDRLTLFLEGQVITTKINLEGFKWK